MFQFNNTRDEMLLYEKYGEDYEGIVSTMSVDEKKRLKREIAGQTPKTVLELLGKEMLEEDDDDDNGQEVRS